MLQGLDVRQVLALASGFTDGGRSQALQLRSDLAAKGRLATGQVSAALVELVDRNRQRNDALRRKVLGELQRRLGASRFSTSDDAAERQFVSDQLSAVVEELAALSRQHHDELRRALQTAAERELRALSLVTQAVAEFAALSRQHYESLHETLHGAARPELNAQGSVTEHDLVAPENRPTHSRATPEENRPWTGSA